MKAWYHSRLYTLSGLEKESLEAPVNAECRNGGDFLRIIMEEIASSEGVERWAECTPEHLLYLKRIKETIPNALIIHIIRDARDVALSMDKGFWICRVPVAYGQEVAGDRPVLGVDCAERQGVRQDD